MSKQIPNSLVPARDGDVLLLTVPNYWGKGKTMQDAKRALRDAYGPSQPKAWRVYSVHPNTYLDDMGMIVSVRGHELIMLAEYDPK